MKSSTFGLSLSFDIYLYERYVDLTHSQIYRLFAYKFTEKRCLKLVEPLFCHYLAKKKQNFPRHFLQVVHYAGICS